MSDGHPRFSKEAAADAMQKMILEGQARALHLFGMTARFVPAYKDFLAKNGVKAADIKTFEAFTTLPVINKENYLRAYPLKDLMWNGDLFHNNLISVSSGSSGEPFFWPRGRQQHEEAAEMYFDLYKHIFGADKTPTLLVVCFSMGTWIAGSYTTFGAMEAADLGLKMNTITPAIELRDSINVIKRLSPLYKQVILAGYPPFIKDMIDFGATEGIDWQTMNVGFTLAGESISEELRNYLLEHGTKDKDPTRVVNIYGTADAGIVAHETPFSVLLRREIAKQQPLIEDFFGKPVLPTFAQYDPLKRYFESVDDKLIFTSPTGLPLIRYEIKDAGGVVTSLDELPSGVLDKAIEASKDGGTRLTPWYRPFVYVHGRSDFTVTLYAVLIYPENLKLSLLDPRLAKIVSGRFAMETKTHENLDQYLEINVELLDGVEPSDAAGRKVQGVIVETLQKVNAEYRKLYDSVGGRALPHVILYPRGTSKHFAKGNKQIWKVK